MKRTGTEHPFTGGRDVWYHDLIAGQSADCPPEPMDAEDLLYILYTSGTTGKPKGDRAHHRRYLTGWPARIGTSSILTGTTCTGAGPTSAGSPGTPTSCTARWPTTPPAFIYEGAPDWPDKDRLWSIAEKRRATMLYTAPAAIRAFMWWGTEYPQKHALSSLRLLGTVGEPINPEA